ncbi:MAG: hypothetical protein SXA11_05690 [Cyanobacteriota bacterium]|nr:hypothetical protein [Cyanobacteriota bacterium]
MKCVNCDKDNNLKERYENAWRCKYCKHPFAFEPQAEDMFTDVFFKRAVAAVSSENTLFFTEKQLAYLLEKRLKNRKIENYFRDCLVMGFWIGCLAKLPDGIFLFIIASIIGITTTNLSELTQKQYVRFANPLVILIGIAGIIISHKLAIVNDNMKYVFFYMGISLGLFLNYLDKIQRNRSDRILKKCEFATPEAVNNWLSCWTEINGSVEKLLPPPTEESSNIEVSSDISAYSFDRLVVCESADMTQLLIANNFHFEHNCAVLSITGYPQKIFNTVMEMLRRNCDLKVYAFHNASPFGVSLLHRLRTSSNWFANSEVAIYDLGLFPRHIFSSSNMWILNSSESAGAAEEMPTAVRENLSADEIAWLEAGNYVELDSFSPQRLLRVVSGGIAKSQFISGDESLGWTDGSDRSFGGNYALFIFDSFG